MSEQEGFLKEEVHRLSEELYTLIDQFVSRTNRVPYITIRSTLDQDDHAKIEIKVELREVEQA